MHSIKSAFTESKRAYVILLYSLNLPSLIYTNISLILKKNNLSLHID